jgi:hypothetical protein
MGQLEWLPVGAILGYLGKMALDEIRAYFQRRRDEAAAIKTSYKEFWDAALLDTLRYVLALFDAMEFSAAGGTGIRSVKSTDYPNAMVPSIGDHVIYTDFVKMVGAWREGQTPSLLEIDRLKGSVTSAVQIQRGRVLQGEPLLVPKVPVVPFSIPEGRFTPPVIPGS